MQIRFPFSGALRRVLLILSVICLQSSAQNYSVNWYKISGGGGAGNGGNFTMRGTIGQPEASANRALTGGNFSITAGFWSLYAVQQAGFPTLHIRTVPPNSAVVFWENIGIYTLQTNSNLSTTNWLDRGGNISLINGTNNVSFNSTSGNVFFRLRQ